MRMELMMGLFHKKLYIEQLGIKILFKFADILLNDLK